MNAPADIVLRASAVAKAFRSGDRRIEVLKHADFEVRAGESVSIRGESGSGKTTLLNILSGLESPDSGVVYWDEQDVAGVARRELPLLRGRHIGMVFQSFYLVPEIDVLQNVVLAARIAGMPVREARERAMALLERMGLSERLHSQPLQLSGGERQRVAVARALINRPRVVLADEPTGNLDERTAGRVMDQLLEVCEGEKASLVLVTHSAEYAARARRSLLLHEGAMRPLA